MPTPIRSKLRSEYVTGAEQRWKRHMQEQCAIYDPKTEDPTRMAVAAPHTGASGTVYRINRITNGTKHKYKWEDVSCVTHVGLVDFLTRYDQAQVAGGFDASEYMQFNDAMRKQWESNHYKNEALNGHLRASAAAFDPNRDFDDCVERHVIAEIDGFWYTGPV